MRYDLSDLVSLIQVRIIQTKRTQKIPLHTQM